MLGGKNRSRCQWPNILTNHEMSGAEVNNERTVLDYLNEYCWQAVLDYVPVRDIILSETVSRRWQQMVLMYLITVRLALEEKRPTYVTHWPKVRCLKLDDYYDDWSSFKLWTEKLGSTVVAAYCTSKSHLKILIKNCPNVESLMINGYKEEFVISHDITPECFQRLRRLCFRNSICVTDRYVSQLINSSVTELEVHGNDDDDLDFINGRFLSSVQSKLESLTLIDVQLQFHYLHSVVDWLSELKKLHLSRLPTRVFENIHLVLDKTPKLEYLHLKLNYTDEIMMNEIDLSKHVCRLTNLRHLSGDVVWTDEHLEVVTRSCRELRTLKIKGVNDVSVRGLEAIVRNAGARLVALDLGSYLKLTDDDMMVCFRGCTKLTTLKVGRCEKLSSAALRELAAAARRGLAPRPPPLRLIRGHAADWIIE